MLTDRLHWWSADFAVPLISRREHAIRNYCGRLLGISADPARVSADVAVAIDKHVQRAAIAEADGDQIEQMLDCIRELISTRSQFANGHDSEQMEMDTDQLLRRLDHLERLAT